MDRLNNIEKLTPIFSVNTLFDLDIGVMNLIIRDYNDPNIFDLDHDYYDLFSRVYYRHFKNPLYSLCKPDIDKLDLDDYYNDFLELKSEEINKLAVITEIPNVIRILKDDGEIIPSIMCDEDRIPQLKTITMVADIEIVSFSKVYYDKSNYTQLFLRDIDEMNQFSNKTFCTFYLPDNNLNFNDDGYLIDIDSGESLAIRRNALKSYTMYSNEIISENKYKKYETLDSYLYELYEKKEKIENE